MKSSVWDQKTERYWKSANITEKICKLCQWTACFHWKHSGRVVFIFSSKTSILVWCGLKQAKYEPKTTHVSDPRLSLGENDRFQKRAYLACFQAENDLYINSGTGIEERWKRWRVGPGPGGKQFTACSYLVLSCCRKILEKIRWSELDVTELGLSMIDED